MHEKFNGFDKITTPKAWLDELEAKVNNMPAKKPTLIKRQKIMLASSLALLLAVSAIVAANISKVPIAPPTNSNNVAALTDENSTGMIPATTEETGDTAAVSETVEASNTVSATSNPGKKGQYQLETRNGAPMGNGESGKIYPVNKIEYSSKFTYPSSTVINLYKEEILEAGAKVRSIVENLFRINFGDKSYEEKTMPKDSPIIRRQASFSKSKDGFLYRLITNPQNGLFFCTISSSMTTESEISQVKKYLKDNFSNYDIDKNMMQKTADRVAGAFEEITGKVSLYKTVAGDESFDLGKAEDFTEENQKYIYAKIKTLTFYYISEYSHRTIALNPNEEAFLTLSGNKEEWDKDLAYLTVEVLPDGKIYRVENNITRADLTLIGTEEIPDVELMKELMVPSLEGSKVENDEIVVIDSKFGYSGSANEEYSIQPGFYLRYYFKSNPDDIRVFAIHPSNTLRFYLEKQAVTGDNIPLTRNENETEHAQTTTAMHTAKRQYQETIR